MRGCLGEAGGTVRNSLREKGLVGVCGTCYGVFRGRAKGGEGGWWGSGWAGEEKAWENRGEGWEGAGGVCKLPVRTLL